MNNSKFKVHYYHCCKCPPDRLMPKAWHSERVDGVKVYYCARHWAVEKKLRNPEKEVQKNKHQNKLEMFFQYVWDNSPHICAECGRELKEFKRWYIHHILAKSRSPYFATDIRNTIILCYQHHNEIESAISERKMKVYEHCEKVKYKLLQEVGIDYECKII